MKDGAPGKDGIMSKAIKCISDHVAAPLTRLTNLSFSQGVFPNELKIALVSPLYKAKDPMIFSNYRPISLLPLFSKILEKLMYNRLLSFLNKCSVINKNQFGFGNKHSTYMALLIMLENIRNALDNGECAVGIFLDIKKRSTPLIMTSYWINFLIMASEELPWNGLKVTCQIDIKLLNIITMNQNLVKYYAESPKGPY